MPLSGAEFVILSELLNEAFDLPAEAQERWLDGLEGPRGLLRDTLRELLMIRARMETSDFLQALPPLALSATLDSFDHALGLKPGAIVGPYELVRPLGAGGMGSVWLATRRDGTLKRAVALKLPFTALQTNQLAERFGRERDILAELAHPNIARLYDAGIAENGQPYLALEFVDGVPLTEFCDAKCLTNRQRLELFLQALAAVQYAHGRLILHRDLKPSNILVTTQHQVMLLDFGIAKLIIAGEARETELTQQGGRALTLDYASPEQVRGNTLGTASDAYSLGVVLYELLTGTRPYRLKNLSRASLEDAVLNADASLPSRLVTNEEQARQRSTSCRRLRRELKGDLDTIVLKALKKNPAERYQGAAELAEDLSRYLRGEAVLARPDSGWYHARKFVARHKFGVVTATAALAVLVGGISLLTWQAQRLAEQRDLAQGAAMREAAVRTHITRLFRESVQKHGKDPPNAKAMLDKSAKEVLVQYHNDPIAEGQVVVALDDLYSALEDMEGKATLLEGFLAQTGPTSDAPLVASVERRLAEAELARGNTLHAAALLDAADSYWRQAPRQDQEEHLQGLLLRGQLQNQQGRKEAALITYNEAIRERAAYSGGNARELAVLYNSLAIVLTELNRGEEAHEAYSRGLQILRDLGLAEELDSLMMLGNSGWLALRVGRLAEAAEALRISNLKARALSGDSAPAAVYLSFYGASLLEYGRFSDALSTLREASPMLVSYAGAGSVPDIRCQAYLSQALFGAGQHLEARKLLVQAQVVARPRYAEGHLVPLNLRVIEARFDVEEARLSDAQQLLLSVIPKLRALGAPADVSLATALVLQGELLLAQSRAADSIGPLTEAVAIRNRVLWSRSWQLAEAQARLGEALATTGDARAVADLEHAATTLAEQLGAAHAQTVRAKIALQSARHPAGV